jgi:hypothetical protein
MSEHENTGAPERIALQAPATVEGGMFLGYVLEQNAHLRERIAHTEGYDAAVRARKRYWDRIANQVSAAAAGYLASVTGASLEGVVGRVMAIFGGGDVGEGDPVDLTPEELRTISDDELAERMRTGPNADEVQEYTRRVRAYAQRMADEAAADAAGGEMSASEEEES